MDNDDGNDEENDNGNYTMQAMNDKWMHAVMTVRHSYKWHLFDSIAKAHYKLGHIAMLAAFLDADMYSQTLLAYKHIFRSTISPSNSHIAACEDIRDMRRMPRIQIGHAFGEQRKNLRPLLTEH